MRTLTLAALLLALAALPAWAGDDDVPSRFLDRYDANDDGRVTPDELAVSEDVFRLLDRDGDGAITRTDLGGPATDRRRSGKRGQGDGQRPGRGPGDGQQPGRGPGGGQGDRGARRQRRLMQMDADGDGRITREEFKGPPELFQRLDANGDGAIDPTECQRAGAGERPGSREPGQGREPGQARGQGRMLERLKQLDKDGDGRVSADEYEGRAPFERLDRNGDGFLDAKDFVGRRGGEGRRGPGGESGRGPGQRPDRARGREALEAMDTNGDGKVSKDEYTGPIPFERLDRNGDGFLGEADRPKPSAPRPPPAAPPAPPAPGAE